MPIGSLASGRPPCGAWIETAARARRRSRKPGRPPCGAWIETVKRWTKSCVSHVAPRAGRGSKPRCDQHVRSVRRVAPRAGAWIETRPSGSALTRARTSPPVRGRGSKPIQLRHRALGQGRPPCGGVDRNAHAADRPHGSNLSGVQATSRVSSGRKSTAGWYLAAHILDREGRPRSRVESNCPPRIGMSKARGDLLVA